MTKPVSTTARYSEMIETLTAAGPFPDYADKLMLFGRLVGGWDIEGRHFSAEGQVTKEQRGEWHFAWVLEGRAIQDVILTPPREERRRTGAPADDYGVAIRFYDPRIDAWRVTALTPVFGVIVNLIARPVGDEIVLEGRAPDNKLYRWIFSDITDQTFRWSGYESADEGRTWFMEEEIRARRRAVNP
ncbi:MAG TPA: hypothetical protein VFM35_03780 [Candidatus Binatia bacterium]|nr:hypothetical protein [Candidatus Binatia bacterium]